MFENKVAFISGASTGIGKATALAVAKQGAAVSLIDTDADRGELVAKEIQSSGGTALFITTDVSIEKQVSDAVSATVTEFGRLDFAFNNAGIEGEPAPTAECSLQNWDKTIAVNLSGVFYAMKYQIPAMLESGGGAIVNNSSIAGLVGFSGIPAYAASKHGVVGLTKSAALEYSLQNIRINAVCPGVIDTEMVHRFTKGYEPAEQQLRALEPVGRMGTPEEIASAVVWLFSDGASFVTGQAIAVDGGFVAR